MEQILLPDKLRAHYILVYVVAEPLLIDSNTYYVLNRGGDEGLTPVLTTMTRIDKEKYMNESGYTTAFWNNTLIGKLIPFTPIGYTSITNEKPTNLFKDYKPGAYQVYSKQIKYPNESVSKEASEPLSLVYSSDSFNKINPDLISAVLIYRIN